MSPFDSVMLAFYSTLDSDLKICPLSWSWMRITSFSSILVRC